MLFTMFIIREDPFNFSFIFIDKVEEKNVSLLGALIAVSIVSVITIAVLSLLLARVVYRHLQKRQAEVKYTSDILLLGKCIQLRY